MQSNAQRYTGRIVLKTTIRERITTKIGADETGALLRRGFDTLQGSFRSLRVDREALPTPRRRSVQWYPRQRTKNFRGASKIVVIGGNAVDFSGENGNARARC